jgi:hypothetical protein
MYRTLFRAQGHQNVVGEHSTTTELTTEDTLTPQGTCIVGVNSTLVLKDLSAKIKELATSPTTKIQLKMAINGVSEVITGWGSPGLTYTDAVSVVARTSPFECGRTVMVKADKAASDLKREFIRELQRRGSVLEGELIYTSQ